MTNHPKITRNYTRKLGLSFIGLDGYLRGMKYFNVYYSEFGSELDKPKVKLYRDLIESVLEDCDNEGNLNPSARLLIKVSRFKKIEGITDTGTFKDLKVDCFCYHPLNKRGIPERNSPEYLKFKEFRKLSNPWVLSEKEIKTYSNAEISNP